MPEEKAITDVIVLALGFIGIEKFTGFPYFASLLEETLRNLKGVRGEQSARTAFRTAELPPAAGLDRRQKMFVAFLKELQLQYGTQAKFHILGHGVAGVDALFLLAPRALARRANPKALEQVTFERLDAPNGQVSPVPIANVVTIGAPVSGTYNTDVLMMKAWRETHKNNTGSFRLFRKRLRASLSKAFGLRSAKRNREALVALLNTRGIIDNIANSRVLMFDLQPERISKIIAEGWSTDNPGPWNQHGARLMHVAVVAPKPETGKEPTDPSRAFYVALTESIRNATPRQLQPAAMPLHATYASDAGRAGPRAALLFTPQGEFATIDRGDNDGANNAVLQGMPEKVKNGPLRRIGVLGDQTSVLGYFGLTDKQREMYGLLESDAAMDAKTFQEYLGDVADFCFVRDE